MKQITLVKAPTILGLLPSGVEEMPNVLEKAGLKQILHIQDVRNIESLQYNPIRDVETKMLNPKEISIYSVCLANIVQEVLNEGKFPLVIGGDCSVILGSMLALKRTGRYGLFFLDGHADFYQPEASVTGQAADMDLALVSGRGPNIVTNIEKQKPLVIDDDIVLFGQRDKEETVEYVSQQVADTDIIVFELGKIRKQGISETIREALKKLLKNPILGFWIHIDVDVLEDSIMPAVDYRMSGGLTFEELSLALKILLSSNKVVGMNLSIFNPRLDSDGTIAKNLIACIGNAFNPIFEVNT